MPMYKVTKFLSEISTFFKKSDSDHAMFAIMNVIKGIRMNERRLFGRKSRSGSKYSLLQVFQLLLVCPCFMIRNPFSIYGSPLGGKLGFRKDVFYEFLNDGRTDWRELMYHIVSQLWTKVIVRSDHKSEDTCLMIDDTDFPKTGRRMENIGRVHSHLEHRSILGFKALFLGITDGISLRRSKRGPWSGLLTTDLDLGFFEAYRIYSRRWSQEVIFKESKGLLGLGKCQSANFAAQIASTSLVALQYNILSAVKRFMDYETIGEIFRQVTKDSHELTISERIWQAILEFVAAITKVFSIDDEEVLDAMVNESDELAHICELYQCKMAS